MSKLMIAACAASLVAVSATEAFAASDAGAVKQTIRALFAKSNAGDTAGTLALCEQDGSIIDDFAPFRWESFPDWLNAYGSYSSANGMSGSKFTILKFAHVNVADDHAYAVVNVVVRYKENGKERKESGSEAITLDKQSAGWRIASYAWFGKGGIDSGADAAAITDAVKSFVSLSTPIAPGAIVDEFGPFHWTGAGATAAWSDGFAKLSKANGWTDTALHLAPPSELLVNGDKGYAAFPTTITYKQHGKPKTEHGGFALAFDKTDGAWHITSWAWVTR